MINLIYFLRSIVNVCSALVDATTKCRFIYAELKFWQLYCAHLHTNTVGKGMYPQFHNLLPNYG